MTCAPYWTNRACLSMPLSKECAALLQGEDVRRLTALADLIEKGGGYG